MTYLRLLAQSSLVTVAPLAHGQGVLPGEATLVSGDAAIATSGPAMTITQSSDKAILDWTDFSIGQDNTVTFLNGSGTTLNRVTGTSLSSLDGLLSATGTIYLINPNGIVVGQNGIVDVGGSFIAATHDVDTAAFLAGGDLDFSGVSDASIINLGKIAAAQGDVFLIAREVTNAGTLEAAQGTAGMAAGYDVLLTDGSLGDGKLQVRVGGAGTSATTRGEIEAASVELRANGGNIYALAGNTGGTIRATGVSHSDGRIFLTAGDGKVTVAGGVTLAASRGAASTLPASAAGSADAPGMQALSAASGMDGSVSDTGSLLLAPSQAMSGTGGDVILSGGKVSVSGEIAATGTEGGSVTITGTDIAVVGGRIDASGETGGGTVRIGGNKHGAPGLQTADTLYFDADSLVRADATRSGNGGQVVLWAEEATSFAGNISARGAGSGTGGDAEVSGKAFLDYTGRTDLRGPGGAGTLLLDPYNLTISNDAGVNATGFDATGNDSVINVTTLETALASANVTITTGSGGAQDGDITVADAFSWSSGTLLTLSAYRDITFNAKVTAANGGGLALEYGQGALASGNTANYYVNAPINLTSDGSFSTKLGSDGTVIDYTIITDVNALQDINNDVTGNHIIGSYVLGANIDASATATWNGGKGFAPISADGHFQGVLDGLGHTISDLTINRPTDDILGLFRNVSGSAVIRNLGLVGADITGQNYVGMLAGKNGATIENVFAEGDVTGGDYVGGLIGTSVGSIVNSYTEGSIVSSGIYSGGIVSSNDGTLSGVYSTADIIGTEGTGGLVGINSGTIEDAFATGSVTGSININVGGLVGRNHGSISNSFATGDVESSGSGVGGLVGQNNDGPITDSYATGTVSGDKDVGGLIGIATGTSSISNVYATGDVTAARDKAGGLLGSLAKTSTLENAFASGDVSGSTRVGGLIGSARSTSVITNAYAVGNATATTGHVGALIGETKQQASVTNTYATGLVTAGTGDDGGLIGNHGSSIAVTNSFYNTETTGQSDTGKGTGLTTAEMQSLSTFTGAGWDIDGDYGTGSVWRIYDGNTTPLLRSFLTPLSLSTAYDGSGAALTDIGAFDVPDGTDSSLILGTQSNNTLTLTSTEADSYTASIDVNGLYSSQLGYDLDFSSATRTISTPGSAAGDIDLSSGVTWTDGTLIINGNVTDAGVISSTNGVFEIAGGSWSQTGTLADFDVFDFRLSGGTFLRATSGDGSEADPYTLIDVYGLQGVDTLVTFNFALDADIDASGTANWWDGAGFDPIGHSSDQFTVHFDGRNHVITDLTINRASSNYVGLFGFVSGSTISNLGLVGGSISGKSYVGGLVGTHDGTITNSFVTSDVSGSNHVGGMVGYNLSGIIQQSYATGSVTGDGKTGGLIGSLVLGEVNNSFATGTVSGGGAGGLVGAVTSGIVTNSFYNTETTGQSDTGKGTGLTTEEIQSLSTFTGAGWDIDDEGGTGSVWRIYDGDTAPLLRSFLTPLSTVLTPAYDGSGSAMNNIGAYEVPDGVDADLILGMERGNTLTLASTDADSYTASIDISGLYSTQLGYDLDLSSGTRTISTPGSAAGDIDLPNGVTWTDGTLIINGNVTDAGVISSTNGVFKLTGGNWSQTGTLADFDVFDFRLSGGSFLRATSGDGSEADPYTLVDVYGLQGVDTLLGSDFVLGGDINASGTANWWGGLGFDAIGASGSAFRGTFDGQGHVISGLIVNRPSLRHAGLFGYNAGTIENVGMAGGSVTGGDNTGGLVGSNLGTILNAYTTGDVSGQSTAGGLAAVNAGTISNSYATGNVSDGYYAGGLIGFNQGDVLNAFATGDVTGTHNAGGLIGLNDGDVSNAYATGDVTSTNSAAGLIGINYGNVSNTYATGTVSGGINSGGLIWYQEDLASVTNSFYDMETTGQSDTGKGTGLTTAEMTDPFTFIDAGWDFETVWSKSTAGENSDYMMLRGFSSDTLYDDFVRLSGDTSKTYGSANPSLDGITLDGAGTDNVTLSWGSALSETTGVGYYAYAGDAGVVDVTGADDRSVYVDYGSDGLTISKAALTVTANDDSKTYDGFAYSGGNGITYDGFVNGEDSSVLGGSVTFGGTSQGAVNAGTYAISASGLTADNYDITFVAGSLDVEKASLTITASDDSKTYDGLTYSGGNGITYDGFVSGEDESVLGGALAYGGTAQGAKDAGTYAIEASGLTSGNYDISYVDGSLDVGKASLTITAIDDGKTYDGVAYSGGNGVSYDGFVSGEDESVLGGSLAYGGTSQGAKDAGDYVIEASGLTSGNYDISYVDGSLDVGKASLTITAVDDGKTYDGVAYSGGNGVTYDGFVSGEDESVLGGSLAYGGTSQGAKDAGDYVIEASGLTSGNYDISYVEGSLDIGKADLIVTARDDGKTYDGVTYAGGNGVSYDGFVSGEDESVLGGSLAYGGTSQGAKDAGDYAIEASGLTSGNYNISYVDGLLNIAKASLTITASDDSKTYDGITYSGGNGVTYDGFASGEDESVLGGTLAYGGTAQGAKDAGSYIIEASGLTSGNYEISYVDGSLDIGKASLTVTAVDDGKTYDGVAYSGGNGVTYDGFVSGEDESVLGGSLSYGGTSQGAKDAGDYAIEASGLTSGNYNISYVDGLLSVAKASLTVTASDDSKTYDGLSYAGGNGVTYDGFVSGEDESVLGGSLAYGGTAQGAKDAGDYVISASGLTSGNYDISYIDGSLDIEKASLTITANDESKTYDGITYAGGNGVSYDGFVDGEDSSVLGGTLTYDGDAQGARDAGTYVITASGLTSGNYDITYLDGALDVARRAITILADAQTKIYGEVDPDLTYTIGGSGLADGDTKAGVLSGALARAAGETVNGGPYAIGQGSLGANANYTLTYVGNDLTITPAALTVTADDQSKIADGSVFEGPYTVTLTGLTGGDDASVLGAIDFGGDAISAVHAGSYQIIPGGAANPNYTITFVNGTLTLIAPTSAPDLPQETPVSGELVDLGGIAPAGVPESGDNALNGTDANPCGSGESGQDCSNMPHPLNQVVDDRIRFTP